MSEQAFDVRRNVDDRPSEEEEMWVEMILMGLHRGVEWVTEAEE